MPPAQGSVTKYAKKATPKRTVHQLTAIAIISLRSQLAFNIDLPVPALSGRARLGAQLQGVGALVLRLQGKERELGNALGIVGGASLPALGLDLAQIDILRARASSENYHNCSNDRDFHLSFLLVYRRKHPPRRRECILIENDNLG